MKVIFSRKGVDSAAGKCASALVDNRPISIPIPTREPSPTTYGMLSDPLCAIASDLSGGRLAADTRCHLDPDIYRDALSPRAPGWRGALGQVSSSLSHLRNQGVGPGDLFLFWGLYRPAEHLDGRWRYSGPCKHAIFGWLMIESVHDLSDDPLTPLSEYPWLKDHPHVRPAWKGSNAIYLATEYLELDGRRFDGSGVFRKAYRLSATVGRPSLWSVPEWLDGANGGVGMSYHKQERWLGNGLLQTAARGQEFVADIDERADARRWLANLLETHA